MPIDSTGGGGWIATGTDSIMAVRFAYLITGLKSEIRGMRLTAKGSTCYSILKREYGFKGSREKVLEQAQTHRDEVIVPSQQNG
jgi:hypothetical protein